MGMERGIGRAKGRADEEGTGRTEKGLGRLSFEMEGGGVLGCAERKGGAMEDKSETRKEEAAVELSEGEEWKAGIEEEAPTCERTCVMEYSATLSWLACACECEWECEWEWVCE